MQLLPGIVPVYVVPFNVPPQPVTLVIADPVLGVIVIEYVEPVAYEPVPETLPDPVPDNIEVNENTAGGLNVAVTVASALKLNPQVPVPEQPPPDHPPKLEAPVGVAVSVMFVPYNSDSEHVEPQLMFTVPPCPATEPAPLPPLTTVSVWVCREKFAVTVQLDDGTTPLNTPPLAVPPQPDRLAR